jgi:ferredoxin
VPIAIEPLRCIGCGLCELACSYRRENAFTTMRSSIMLKMEDKRGYFGVMIKRENGDLLLGRPEGVQLKRSGLPEDGIGSKPIMLRPACDECTGDHPRCVAICPTGCLREER